MRDPASTPAAGVDARTILRLAAPAAVVLVAEPLYLLLDLAVVGHLGAAPLAALAAGAIVIAQVTTQLTFLSYGTTSRAARLFGAGRRVDAVGEGVQATWLAVGIGLGLMLLVQLLAVPIVSVLTGGRVVDAAVSWLRIAALGVPLVLVALAGNGWMRGVQDTRRPPLFVGTGVALSAVLCPVLVHPVGMGLVGSAIANVAGQAVTAGLFLRALVVEGALARPDRGILRAQLVLARDLVLRSLAFQVCFLSAAAVAARFGEASLGAHQVALQIWNLISLLLDSLAIAAQSLVGAALGAASAARAVATARKVTVFSVSAGLVVSLVLAGGIGVLPRLFTADGSVLAEMAVPWWFLIAMTPFAAVVFALDGVLLGAGDAAFLRTATIGAALVGFLPVVWVSLVGGWGLTGIWSGLAAFILLRMVAVWLRARSGRWITEGVR